MDLPPRVKRLVLEGLVAAGAAGCGSMPEKDNYVPPAPRHEDRVKDAGIRAMEACASGSQSVIVSRWSETVSLECRQVRANPEAARAAIDKASEGCAAALPGKRYYSGMDVIGDTGVHVQCTGLNKDTGGRGR